MAVNPQEVYAWDDTGNNRWLISGRGAGIMNPPSAWAVAKRDNLKVAENCWHHPMPKGPKGRFVWTLSRRDDGDHDRRPGGDPGRPRRRHRQRPRRRLSARAVNALMRGLMVAPYRRLYAVMS
jgi:hypothetical protein